VRRDCSSCCLWFRTNPHSQKPLESTIFNGTLMLMLMLMLVLWDRWPPRMVERMADFLAVRQGAAPANA
jgi:hypothetical protein